GQGAPPPSAPEFPEKGVSGAVEVPPAMGQSPQGYYTPAASPPAQQYQAYNPMQQQHGYVGDQYAQQPPAIMEQQHGYVEDQYTQQPPANPHNSTYGDPNVAMPPASPHRGGDNRAELDGNC